MNALLSLYSKNGSEYFAAELIKRGYNIISSGGTAKYLSEKGIPVTDISTITGFPPVLGHRVVTLAPQIHGPLLATAAMRPELEALKWPDIHLLYVTFYPLEEELKRPDATFESCIEKTDIGGPTMIRSANKGGNVIVMTRRRDENHVLTWLDAGTPEREAFLFDLRAQAELTVERYIHLSAEVYQRFAKERGVNSRSDFPRYLMKVGKQMMFLPLQDAAAAYADGFTQVSFGDLVLESDLSVRRMSLNEGTAISDLADRISGSK